MTAYYNEFDPFAAAWLRELIKAGHIAPGDVDERSIEDVHPSDLIGYTQCHFFAGIGVWSYALRLAGWPDDRPVWTGSCPCQPFSAAGKGEGTTDERHLWPAYFHLIQHRRPSVVFGEQVEAAIKHGWLDLVQDDLEGIDYSFGAAGFPAASIGAPHIRQRLYFVADYNNKGLEGWGGMSERSAQFFAGPGSVAGRLADTSVGRSRTQYGESGKSVRQTESSGGHSVSGGLAYNSVGRRGRRPSETVSESCPVERSSGLCDVGGLADTECGGRHDRRRLYRGRAEEGTRLEAPLGSELRVEAEGDSSTGFWSNAEWIYCRDEKYRPVEPGTFPLAHGATNRVGRLRGYGNAIVAPQAAEFIRAYEEAKLMQEIML